MKFQHKIVLITGGSRGIGRATAVAFAREGATVAINYRTNQEAAQETLALLGDGDHRAFSADVSDPDSLESLFESVILHYGRLDILVNNAGIAINHPINEISFESWQDSWNRIINTNLMAIANACYLAVRQMMRQGGGRIVNVSSRGAFRGEPLQPAYGASKAGLNALSQSLARQLGSYHIFVNVVAPGFVDTDMASDFLTESERIEVENQSPLQRMAKPEEVAQAILYLASDESAFTTGAILDINGASYLRT